MSVFSSSGPPALGSINAPAYFPSPSIPHIVAELYAVLPLVLHLASYRSDHQLIGKTSLLGRLHISIFPKLGVLNGIASLLSEGPHFLDQASIKGGATQTVWDVMLGGYWPSANGSASSLINKYALKDVHISTKLFQESGHHDIAAKSMGSFFQRSVFARYQTLHILYFSRTSAQLPSMLWSLDKRLSSLLAETISILASMCLVVALSLFGAYGTSVIVFCGAIAQIASRYLAIQRPKNYMENNEQHRACMLSASHQNATTWYLWIGDRGVIDGVLNKCMILVPTNRRSLGTWLQVIHYVQLLAVTFVAAQKGWDGIVLVCLMNLTWIVGLRFSNHNLVRRWLHNERIDICAKSFQFSGRISMMGSIYKFSKTGVHSWMDMILIPHPRRDALLAKIAEDVPAERLKNETKEKAITSSQEKITGNQEKLGDFDRKWVAMQAQLINDAVKVLQQEFNPVIGHKDV